MKTESTSQNEFPETLHDAIKFFANEDVAFEFMKRIRWPDGKIACPRCGSEEHSFITTRKLWTCKRCTSKKQFTIKVGTVMEDSPIGYDKWICGFWLIANAKNGISSYEVGRALGVTQRTGWFLLHRIRTAMQSGSIMKLGGTVEVDESWIGGSARNMHKAKKAKVMNGNQNMALTPVQGLLERTTRDKCSQVKLQIIKSTKRAELHGNVRKYVLKGATVHTDALSAYRGLEAEYTHEVVDHAIEYVRGNVHTNGLENFWSLLKRMIKGTYVNVEPFHLFRYLDEQAFRFNERKDTDLGRFMKAIAGFIGKRLTWAKLTDADGLLAGA